MIDYKIYLWYEDQTEGQSCAGHDAEGCNDEGDLVHIIVKKLDDWYSDNTHYDYIIDSQAYARNNKTTSKINWYTKLQTSYDWLTEGLPAWLSAWLLGCLPGWLTDGLTDLLTDEVI